MKSQKEILRKQFIESEQTTRLVDHVWWSIGYWRGWHRANRESGEAYWMYQSQTVCRVQELRNVAEHLKPQTDCSEIRKSYHSGFRTGYVAAVECGLQPKCVLSAQQVSG